MHDAVQLSSPCRGSRHVSNLAAVPWAHPSGWPAPRSRDAEASALRQWVLGTPLRCRALDSPSGLPAPRSRDASASALGQWVLDVGTPAGGAPLGARRPLLGQAGRAACERGRNAAARTSAPGRFYWCAALAGDLQARRARPLPFPLPRHPFNGFYRERERELY